jgi:hypothetical protein
MAGFLFPWSTDHAIKAYVDQVVSSFKIFWPKFRADLSFPTFVPHDVQLTSGLSYNNTWQLKY